MLDYDGGALFRTDLSFLLTEDLGLATGGHVDP